MPVELCVYLQNGERVKWLMFLSRVIRLDLLASFSVLVFKLPPCQENVIQEQGSSVFQII